MIHWNIVVFRILILRHWQIGLTHHSDLARVYSSIGFDAADPRIVHMLVSYNVSAFLLLLG